MVFSNVKKPFLLRFVTTGFVFCSLVVINFSIRGFVTLYRSWYFAINISNSTISGPCNLITGISPLTLHADYNGNSVRKYQAWCAAKSTLCIKMRSSYNVRNPHKRTYVFPGQPGQVLMQFVSILNSNL